MAQMMTISLNRGDAPNLGFRLQGGVDFAQPLVIQKINGGSPAARAGLQAGDAVIKINNTEVFNLRHKDAQDVIIRAGPAFSITIQRGGSTWRPSVTPVGGFNQGGAAVNNISPVTKTSLAAKPQQSIGAIGTGHNVAAKPFANGTANGGPKLVNKQYNSPIGLYSEQNIAETLTAQSEVLSTGALGVNFKKNEKSYDASKSAVYSMLQEAENEPRDVDAEPDSGVVTASLGGLVGLKHVEAPISKPAPPTPQLPPGQNICADCERLIVGVFVRIKDKNLHVECFKCSTCGASLKNVGYYNINNKLYCDVHAKLAAKANPPGSNLVPITIPPGGKAPASAISSALSSHSLPSPGPISPKIGGPLSPSQNITPAPFQSENSIKNIDTTDSGSLTSIKLLKSIIQAAAAKKSETQKSDTLTSNSSVTSDLSNLNITPKQNYTTAPRPFSSVTAPAPLSPNNYSRPLPKAPVQAPAPAPIVSPYSSTPVCKDKVEIVENIVWPPLQEDITTIPTASPLYFPPPTHVHVKVKQLSERPQTPYESNLRPITPNAPSEKSEQSEKSDSDYQELEDYTNYLKNMEPKMSLCSNEVYNINERRSTMECVESLAEHLQTAMLVDSIMKTQRPKSPPPLQGNVVPQKMPPEKKEVQKESPISSVCPLKCQQSCCNECPECPMKKQTELRRLSELERLEEMRAKIQNNVAQGWESQMVTALRTTPDKPFCVSPEFAQIPSRKPQGPLASALAVAPQQPFTPIKPIFPILNTKPIPLPEETVPYLPPERPVIPENKEKSSEKKQPPQEKPGTPFVEALKTAPERPFTPIGKGPTPIRKKPEPDPLLKDLPKPSEKLSMLSALTTAPDRNYSPLTTECQNRILTLEEKRMEESKKEEILMEEKKKFIIKPPVPQPFIATMVDTFEGNPINPGQQIFPSSQVQDYHADYQEVKQEISSQITEQQQMQAQVQVQQRVYQQQKQEMREEQHVCCIHQKECRLQKEREIARQNEEIIFKKPLTLSQSLQKSEYIPSYQASLQYQEEIELPHHKDVNKLLKPYEKESKIIPTSRPLLRPESHHEMATPPPKITKPVTVLTSSSNPHNPCQNPCGSSNPGHNPGSDNVFQPVNDNFQPPTSATPQRLGQPTSSKINKTPSAIPYYQQNLVATQYLAPESNVFDPKTPERSRSPSPCPGARADRPSSPFKKSSPRPKSPAAGPPPNPLLKHKDHVSFQEDFKVESAKEKVTSYIPHHQEKYHTIQRREGDYYDQSRVLDVAQSRSEINQENFRQQSQQMQAYQADNLQRHQEYVQGDAKISRKEQAKSEQLQQLNKMQAQSVETSADGRVQVQRKKTVVEEFEQSHKERNIEIQKSYPFQKVNVPTHEEHGIVGLHFTNPQPINSPFLRQPAAGPPPMPKAPIVTVTRTPEPPPPQPKPAYRPVQPPVKISVPVPSLSSDVLASTAAQSAPNVPGPNVGAGSGRQSGGSVFAPKRGRGVLNMSGIGARIATCGSCHQQIRGPFITALGKIWCPDHFVCATTSCRRPLQDIGFVEERGQLHCEYCFEQYLAPNCAKCSSKIKGDCLKAIGKNFHPECFNCAHCGKLFGNSPFFLEDGLPYCEGDWNEMFTTKCFACGFPVEAGDRWVEALNNNYHSQCFNCTMCKKNLEGQSFYAKGGRPFCKNHAR